MKCSEARQLLSPMMDFMLSERQERRASFHLSQCAACREQFAELRRTRRLVSTLPSRQLPTDLMVQLRAALSQHMATRRMSRWDSLLVRWENALNAFMFPATAGLVSAILIFGLLLGVLVPAHLPNANDVVPSALYTPPEMTAAPFGLESGSSSDGVLVEALIDPQGRVQDYRVLSAPGLTELTPQMKNALIFTQFRPATSFGMPTSGRVVISFSNISVGG
jgi:anti-sigma factor RsiW